MAQIGKAFTWGLVTKLPNQRWRQVVLSCMSTAYMFGRGTGAIIAPVFTDLNYFGIFIASLNGAATIFILASYRWLQRPEPPSIS